MTLKIYLLGQFKLQADDQPIELPSRPAQSLLAYLVLNAGVMHRREKLASLLWPEASEANARGYLRQALWRIHKALESGALDWEDYLTISEISVAFDERSDYWLDADRLLERVEGQGVDEIKEELRLYRGELLPGFYEEWVGLERDRLQAAYHQKMTILLESLIQRAAWEEVLKWGEEWIRLGYAPEPAFRALMTAHAGLGDQGMLSATYQRCVESLDRELDLGPSPETQQLYERLRRGEVGGMRASPTSPVRPGEWRPAFLEGGEGRQVEKSVFVAREGELAQLDGYLERALAGRGRMIFITGETGSGKTALVQEFTRRAQDAHADLIVASGNCNAYTGIGDPYLPFREILELLSGGVEARLAAGAISSEHAHRLWNMLPAALQALAEVGPDLVDTFVPRAVFLERAEASASGQGRWLSRLDEFRNRQPVAGISGSGLQQSDLFEQYTRVLQALAQQTPLILWVDDLQWADLGSISLLFHLGRRLAGSRILILGTYRPEEVAIERDGARHPLDAVVNELQRLFGDIAVNMDSAEGKEFVEAFLDSEPNRLGLPFREMLYRQTRGQPLFTIELLRGLQERGDLVQDAGGYWVEGKSLDWETLPVRVEAAFAERLSRLAQPLQAALRVACVEGEVFTAEVVSRILSADEHEILGYLSEELDRRHHLIKAVSIQRLDGQLISHYRFRHILFQRYLYGSLDEVERVHLHEQVGTTLEGLYGSQEEILGIAVKLALHFQKAKIVEKAVHYLHLAGERAVQLSAYQDGTTHLTKGLELLFTLPDTSQRDQQELAMQISLGIAWKIDPSSPNAEKALTRARQLCLQMGKTSVLSRVMAELSTIHYVRAEYREAREMAEEALNHAQQTGDPLLVTFSHWILGFILFGLGEYLSAHTHLEQVMTFYDPQQHHRTFVHLLGVDAGLSAQAYAACCLWCLGYPDQALKRSQQVLTQARDLEHAFTQADVLCYGGCLFNAMCREPQTLIKTSDEMMQIVQKNDLPGWLSMAMFSRGEALVMVGRVQEGIALMLQGVEGNETSHVRCYLPWTLCFIAEGQAKLGQAEEGLATLARAFALVEETGERHWEAELYRLEAQLLLVQGDEEGAQASLEKALQIARRQSARSLELRAAVDLARLWRNQSKTIEARRVLAEVYNWFTEGFDTPDLIEARELLEEIDQHIRLLPGDNQVSR